jgi:hemin uptake protein HemP
MTDENETTADDPKPTAPPQSVKLFRSEELFDGERVVCIEHAGAIYRLQITSRGKLILQK